MADSRVPGRVGAPSAFPYPPTQEVVLYPREADYDVDVDDRLKRMWQMMEVPSDPQVLVRPRTSRLPRTRTSGHPGSITAADTQQCHPPAQLRVQSVSSSRRRRSAHASPRDCAVATAAGERAPQGEDRADAAHGDAGDAERNQGRPEEKAQAGLLEGPRHERAPVGALPAAPTVHPPCTREGVRPALARYYVAYYCTALCSDLTGDVVDRSQDELFANAALPMATALD